MQKKIEAHDGQLWNQFVCGAIGIHPSPSFANIFLARIFDNTTQKLTLKHEDKNPAYGRQRISRPMRIVLDPVKIKWSTYGKCFA